VILPDESGSLLLLMMFILISVWVSIVSWCKYSSGK
jgi:hypothetical protein